MPEIRVVENLEKLSQAAVDLFVEIANEAIEDRGQFSVALSGGSTPASLYKLLASDRFREALDWNKVFFFFGDERNVPANSPDSNYRLASETLFPVLHGNLENVRAWQTSLESPEETARDYALKLERYFRGLPLFDLILLGLGTDCHTASLFPSTKALRSMDETAVANWVPQFNDYRFTMTFPVINNSRNIIFLVSGKEKAEAVSLVLESPGQPGDYPAQGVQPTDGTLYWLLDEPAASLLKNR
jgi:6-phosphogluconolactonase